MKGKSIIYRLVTVFILSASIAGCQARQAGPIQPPLVGDEAKVEVIKWQTVFKTNWMATAFIIAIVLGVISGLNGLKMGWSIVIACGAGLYLSASYQAFAAHAWLPVTVAAVGIIASGGFVFWSIFKDKEAIKDIVKGGEVFKTAAGKLLGYPDGKVENLFDESQREIQTPATQKIVTKAKKKIGRRVKKEIEV